MIENANRLKPIAVNVKCGEMGTVVIVGCGLLGGSLGLALRSRGFVKRVVGVGRNEQRLRLALDAGAVDSYTTNLEEACRDADWIILCTPVSIIRHQLAVALESVDSENVNIRRLAVLAFSDIGVKNKEVVAALNKAYKDKDSRVRKRVEFVANSLDIELESR